MADGILDRFRAYHEIPREYYDIHIRIMGSLPGAVLLHYLLKQFDYHRERGRDTFWHTNQQIMSYTSLTPHQLRLAKSQVLELGFITVKRAGCRAKSHFAIDLAALDKVLAQYPPISDARIPRMSDDSDARNPHVYPVSDARNPHRSLNELENSTNKKKTPQAAAEGRLGEMVEEHPLLTKARGEDGVYHMSKLTEAERDELRDWEFEQEEKEEKEYAKKA